MKIIDFGAENEKKKYALKIYQETSLKNEFQKLLPYYGNTP